MSRPAPRALAVLAAAALAAALPACGGGGPAAPPAAKPSRAFRVGVLPVAARPLVYALEAVGTVEALDVVTVPARVPGPVENLSFEEGSTVDTDQVLAVVDGRRYALGLEEARAAVGRAEALAESAGARIRDAEAARAEAEASLGRRRKLRETNPGWVTEDEIGTLEAVAARARAGVEQATAEAREAAAAVTEARARVALAEKDETDARVRSPIAGTIQRRHVARGQYVRAGDPVATLVDASRLRIRFRVSEPESIHLAPGREVTFSVAAFPGRDLAAKVIHVSATADPVTRMVECLAEATDPPAGLRPGFFASVRAEISRETRAVVVPVGAVLPTERGFVAYVVVDGKAKERKLVLGLHTRDEGVEVVAGLEPGEILVVAGAGALEDGVAVDVAPSAGPPAAAPAPAPAPAPAKDGR